MYQPAAKKNMQTTSPARRAFLTILGLVGAGAVGLWPAVSQAQRTAIDDLFAAVKRNNGQTVLRLIEQGVDVNVRDETGQTPMTLALQLGSAQVFDALMSSSKTNVEYRNAQDESALMIAAIRGNLDAVTRLMHQGAHVNKPGWTPLHYAASGAGEQQAPIARLLLEKHAFIDAESPNGTTPLMMAAQYGTDAVAHLLMQSDADPLMQNQLKLTAEDFAKRVSRDRLASEIRTYADSVRAHRAK